MSAESPVASGLRLGRYVLERKIASGGMADVYLGRQLGAFGFAKSVAVKVLKDDVSGDPEHVRMFVREAMLAAEFKHPALAQVYEVGEEGGRLYIAMELVRGISLTTLMVSLAQKGRSVPIPLAVRIAREALDGLAHAHEAVNAEGEPLRLVHRDVTPHNILVDVAGTVKVVDFGIARAETRAGRTQGAQIKGKFGYMAPEQWEASKDIDARADLFGLGVVLYEMSTGSRRLFKGSSAPELYRAIVKETIPPPTLRVAEYPNTLSTVVMRALERDPARRWPDARAMRDALDRVLEVQNWSVTADDLARLVALALDGRSIEDRWESLASTEEVTSTDAAPAADDAPDPLPDALATLPLAAPSPDAPDAPAPSATVSARPSALGLVEPAPTPTPSPAVTEAPRPSAPSSPPRATSPVTVWMGAALAGWLVALAMGVTWWRTRERLGALEGSGPIAVAPPPPPLREVPAPLRLLADPTLADALAVPWGESLTGAAPGLRVAVDRGDALPRLLRGDGEVALHVGRATDAQAAEARALGLDLRSPASERPVGYDHAAVVVHPSNPLPSLSVDALARLMAGGVRSFHELHGNRERPVVLVGGAGSPTRAFLDDVVLPAGGGRRALSVAPDAVVVAHEAAAVSRVAADPAAVALVRLAWVNPSVRVVPLDVPHAREPVAPTRDAVRAGLYPLARPVVLYTRGAPVGAAARLAELALSPAGQTLLERAGYVSR
ncbi:MAG: serine/threonine-protein kinase [Polyangiales bacterium]